MQSVLSGDLDYIPSPISACRGKEEQQLRFKALLHRVNSMGAGAISLWQDWKKTHHTGSLQSTCRILRSILLCSLGRDWILVCVASAWAMNLTMQIGNKVVFASSFIHLCFLWLGRVKSWPRIAPACFLKLSYLPLQMGKVFQESPERTHRDPKMDFSHTNLVLQSWKTLHKHLVTTRTPRTISALAERPLWPPADGWSWWSFKDQEFFDPRRSDHFTMLDTEVQDQTRCSYQWLLPLSRYNLKEELLFHLARIPLQKHLHSLAFTWGEENTPSFASLPEQTQEGGRIKLGASQTKHRMNSRSSISEINFSTI